MQQYNPLTNDWCVGMQYGLGTITWGFDPRMLRTCDYPTIDPKLVAQMELVGHIGQDWGSRADMLSGYNKAFNFSAAGQFHCEAAASSSGAACV